MQVTTSPSIIPFVNTSTPNIQQGIAQPLMQPAAQDRISDLVESSKVKHPSIHAYEDAEIMIVDLDALEKAEGDVRREQIQLIGEAFEKVGFIAIRSAKIIPIIKNINQMMERYFTQDLEVKLKDWYQNSGQGYWQQGRETAAGGKKADLKESFFIPPSFDQWPKDFQGFKEAVIPFRDEMEKLTLQFMNYIAEYLHENPKEMESHVDFKNNPNNLIRLAYYPAPKSSDDPEAIRAGAHTDLNALTFLPSSSPGLQLLDKDGNWKNVNCPEDVILINPGDQLHQYTGGKIKAIWHRVLNPTGDFALKSRQAVIFFGSLKPDFSLAPLPSCLEEMTKNMTGEEKDQYLKQYPDVTVHEYTQARLMEMGTISDPSVEDVRSLREKGLLKKPPEALVNKYPETFTL